MALVAALFASCATAVPQALPEMKMQVKSDEQAILEHIHGIFQAFLDRDRDKLRETHSDDWVGFMGPSTKIERGLGDYMINADLSLENFHGTGYELLDTEIQIHGDLGLVFYVARYDYANPDGESGSIPLRSLDLYRRSDQQWVQFGSHITVIPSGGAWGEGN